MKDENKLIDKNLSKNVNEDFVKEIPSSNFTHLVMQEVESKKMAPSITDKPLVGRVGWIIFGIFGILFFYVLSNGIPAVETEFKIPSFDIAATFSRFSVIPTTICAVGLLIFVDIIFRRKKKLSQ